MRRYWVSLAAQEHVLVVRDKGYTQANMGAREGIDKMNIGDWIRQRYILAKKSPCAKNSQQ